MRRGVIATTVAAVGVAGVVSSGGATAARPTPHLVVSASRSASALVHVAAPIRAGMPFDGVPMTTHATYAGYLLTDRRGTPLLGRLYVAGVGLGPDESIPIWFSDKKLLPAGTYRLDVVTDAPVTLQIPLAGGKSQQVHVTGRSDAYVRRGASDLPSVGPVRAPVDNIRIPVPAGSYTMVALVHFFSATAQQASYDAMCITGSVTCAAAGDGSGGWMLTPGSGGGTTVSGSSTSPQEVQSGEQAVFDSAVAGVPGANAAMVLAFR